MGMTMLSLLAVMACVLLQQTESYKIGVGRADCTGPPVEITFMGYANLKQKGRGLHLRQYARAFVIEDDDGNRVAFVSVDAGMVGNAVKREALARLTKRFQNKYTFENVIVSGTHTHSAPGGYLMDLLYDISILGFVPQTFDAMAQCIYLSTKRANDNLTAGRIFISQTTVLNANINRSPTSYLRNPIDERVQYEHDVDKTLTQLKFIDSNNTLIGAFHWFPVHATSMNNTNHLVSSDNVGYASMLLEKQYNPSKLAGKGKFVGAFASTNLGDVSPNIMGPKCQISGNDCNAFTSTCPKHEGDCFASGPGRDMFESTEIIAKRLYEGAEELLAKGNDREITGEISFVHQFVDMTKYSTNAYNPLTKKVESIQGCYPAMGYSFAAGTIDGPGSFDFEQGTISANALWNAVRDFIVPPTQEDISCHKPKPILLATGRATFPYDWQPKIVPNQVFKIGNLVLAAVPGEPTTMAGRRLRNIVKEAIKKAGGGEVEVIITGLSNVYSSYITTPEEYQVQRYEAASTIYGPQTLTIYQEIFKVLSNAVVTHETVDGGPAPPYLNDRMLSLQTGVLFDGHPIGKDFGTCKIDALKQYTINDLVYVVFIAGNPRNNLFTEKSYFVVEKKMAEDKWKVILTDANWETKMIWERTSTIMGFSEIRIEWVIGADTASGDYRIRHFGSYKYILGGIFPYEGISRTFSVK